MTAHMASIIVEAFFCCGIMGSHVKANEKLRLIFNTSCFVLLFLFDDINMTR